MIVGRSRSRVLAVVVTYCANHQLLVALLRSLSSQVESTVIVDNTPWIDAGLDVAINEVANAGQKPRLIRLGQNCGIAAALNLGIEEAIGRNFDYVLLSDQDSMPAGDMVENLLNAIVNLASQGVRVGCVGPTYFDRAAEKHHQFQVQEEGRLFYSTCDGELALPWIEVISTITSGSLIPTSVFGDVGMMREDYFIDFVDTEWCHRARHCGYRIYGTSLARMEHQIGDETFEVWYGRWKPFSGYPPERLYYRFRNSVFLLCSATVPLRWKLRSAWTWVGNIYAFSIFAPNRIANIRAILRGLFDGLRGRRGAMR